MRSLASSRRLRLWLGLGWLASAIGGCGVAARPDQQRLTQIGDLKLDAKIVPMLAARDGISEPLARQQAVETLRLASARLAHVNLDTPEHNFGISDDRRDHLLRTARARLWLREVFEPTSRAEDIPKSFLDEKLDHRRTRTLHFHERVLLVCNVLIVPSDKDDDGKNRTVDKSDLNWGQRARQAMEPIQAVVNAHQADLQTEKNCDLLFRYLKFAAFSATSEFELRLERFPVVNPDHFTKQFSAQVLAVETRGTIIDPFMTEYGLHLVVVPRVLAANLPDGTAPDPELRRLRREALRDLSHSAWRKSRFEAEIERMRNHRVVRLSTTDSIRPSAPLTAP